MSTVKSKKLQVGTDATSSNNFTIYQPSTPDGTLRIGVGNADSPTEVGRFDSNGITMASGKTITANIVPTDTIAFSAYHSANVAFNGTSNPFTFTSERFDIGGNYNASTSTFTCPVDGIYDFGVSGMFMSEATYTFIFLAIMKNGSTMQEFMREGARADYATHGGRILIQCNAGDTITVAPGLSNVDSGYWRGGLSFNTFEGILVSRL